MTALNTAEQLSLNQRLMDAAEHGSAEAISALVRQGAQVNFRHSEMGYSPLHSAASSGKTGNIRQLLKLGANPTACDALGNNALMYAAYNNQPEAISCLLYAVADYPLETGNRNGKSALSLCLLPHYKQDAATRLLDAGAQPHAATTGPDGKPQTPFSIAKQQGNEDALYLMHQYSEAPNLHHFTRESALDKNGTLLKHPAGWAHFPHIAAGLETKATPLTKADLLAPYHEDRCYLARAAECNRLPEAMRYLHRRGEVLTAADLLDAAGRPNALLGSIIARQSLASIMTKENWLSQSSDALNQVWRALPEDARQQIDNYYSLRSSLQNAAQGQQRGR